MPDEREQVPAPCFNGFWVYLGAVTAAGLALLLLTLSTFSPHDLPHLGLGFAAVSGLILLGELRPLVTPGSTDVNGITISTAFCFALLLHWGLAPAVLLQAVATIVAEFLKRRAWWRTAFNVGQYTLSWSAAAAVLWLLGRGAGPTHPLALNGGDLWVVALASAAYFLTNAALVAKAIALLENLGFVETFCDGLGYQIVTSVALLALSPLVVVAMERSAALVPLFLLPLLAVYKNAAVSVERERQALHDALTGLPNRKLLLQRATEALEDGRRAQQPVALFLLDLDRFKEVNDTLGHHVGDQLLRLVATRLESTLRPGDTVARLGGDEFAVLLPYVENADIAAEIAARTRDALSEPFRLEGMLFDLEASVGIALCPEHASDYDELMARADVAMYLAKETRSGVEVYVAEKDRNSTTRLGVLGDLRRGLEDHELELHYQPKARILDGAVVGVEALVRWRHPVRGLVPPDDFVPVAEQSALIGVLTQYVVRSALAQAADWLRGGLAVPVAVNVSMRDLNDLGFADFLSEALEEHEVPPSLLELEITESVLMADPTRAAVTLRSLHALGVALSLDDFGTGYSSLVHLKRLPVSEIKIDRGFVQRMEHDEDDRTIVRSIIDLGTALGLRVVAEGVETARAWEQLGTYGCDVGQGWHLARPMPAEQATAWLDTRLRSDVEIVRS